jgi:predicted transcriptional regulator
MDKVNKKRDRLGIIYDILTTIKNSQNSIKPTPLLRHSNLSSARFSEYYNDLLKKELVREINDKNGKFVTLTDKGFNYIEKYKSISGFIEEFEL